MLLADGCHLGGHQHCNGHNIEAMSILLAIPIPGSHSGEIPRPEIHDQLEAVNQGDDTGYNHIMGIGIVIAMSTSS